MTEEGTLTLARESDGILQNPAIQKAFDGIETHYFQVWSNSKPSQYELREEAHGQLFALAQFRRQLQSFIENGKIITAVVE